MQRVIKSDEYILHKYCEVNIDQGKIRKRFNIRASAIGKASSFQEIIVDDLANADDFARDKAKTTFHRVFVEQIQPTFMERDEALFLLEEHVTNNILKVCFR